MRECFIFEGTVRVWNTYNLSPCFFAGWIEKEEDFIRVTKLGAPLFELPWLNQIKHRKRLTKKYIGLSIVKNAPKQVGTESMACPSREIGLNWIMGSICRGWKTMVITIP